MSSRAMHLRRVAACAATTLAFVAPIASAQSVRTITDVWGGSNNGAPGCAATFGPTPELQAFFNGGGFRAVGGNTACGYSGFTTDQSRPGAPLVTTGSLPSVLLGNPADPYGSFSAGVAAQASYTSLGVEARGVLTGAASNTDAISAAAAAFFEDLVTATAAGVAAGSAGFVRYTFALDGSLVTPAAGEAYHPGFATVELDYQLNGGPIFRDAYLNTSAGGGGVISALDGDTSGFVSGPGTIAGSGTFLSGLLPIQFGLAYEFRVGMLAQTIGEGAAAFFSTARIAGVELFDAAGRPIMGDLVGLSGTDYVHPGVAQPVPEPETWALLAAGLGAMGWLRRRRLRVADAH